MIIRIFVHYHNSYQDYELNGLKFGLVSTNMIPKESTVKDIFIRLLKNEQKLFRNLKAHFY